MKRKKAHRQGTLETMKNQHKKMFNNSSITGCMSTEPCPMYKTNTKRH